MTRDLLLELNDHPNLKRLVQSLGLPIPVPPPLNRASGPISERPLDDLHIGLLLADPALVTTSHLASRLAAAGAFPHLSEPERFAPLFQGTGEAWGRPPRALEIEPEGPRLNGLVFDATTLSHPRELRAIYDAFHPLLRRIARGARLIVLGRPSPKDPTAAATQAALEGFVRSIAKEVGRRGATAHLIRISPGAEPHLTGLLRFLLSPRSAYISGQVFDLSPALSAVEQGSSARSLEGKVALVTGAARGIGAATAERLADEGAHVVLLDRPADDGPTAKLARKIHGTPLLVDVTDAEAPTHISQALEALGGVDIVVHNAGITRDKTLARMKPELWDLTLDVNLGAVIRINDALLEGPLNEGGRIVCLSSTVGIAGNMGQTNYAASKAGILGYVERLGASLTERGIGVNAVAPGFIETRLTSAIPTAVREVARRLNNLSQGGLPSDVAELIVFLSSPASSGLTGTCVRVCGGQLIGA